MQGADVQRIQECMRGFFLFDVNCIVRGMSICLEVCSNVMHIMPGAVTFGTLFFWSFLSLCNKCPYICFIYRISITKRKDETSV